LNTSSRSWRDNREKNDQIASLTMQRLSKVIYDITLSPWICLPGFHIAGRS